jgi:hypothetical protein
MIVVDDDNELRRRAQPLLDRPPYEPLPLDQLRSHAVRRKQRARRRFAVGLSVVLVGAGTVIEIRGNGGSSDQRLVTAGTSTTLPPVTAPAGTTMANLRFTPIAGPDGDNAVELHAVGDGFLAVEGAQGVSRAWSGDAAGRWHPITVPDGLRGERVGSVVQLRDRVIVVADTNQGPVVLAGASLDHLKRSSPWTVGTAAVPARIRPAPPPGRGVVVSGYVETTAVGEAGIVMVGRASATLNRELLPKSVRDAFARPVVGRIDVTDGRVVAWVERDGVKRTLYDRPAGELGLTDAEVAYLSRSDDSRAEIVVWGAAWGKPIRQLSGAGIDPYQRYGNFALAHVSDGFVLTAPTSAASELWWSRDGRSWLHLASPPHMVTADDSWLIELGTRWVISSAGGISDDKGRSWTAIDLSGDVAHRTGAASLFGSHGTSAFGLLAGSTPIDASTVTTFAGRLLYTPDGSHWSSVALDDLLDFAANIPTIAVGDTAAILEAGLRAPGVQPQRFWRITLRR